MDKTVTATLLNSCIGVVEFDKAYLAANDLYKYIRNSSRGINKSNPVDIAPFERLASKEFVKAYPDYKVHYAQKVIVDANTEKVSVVLFLQKPLVKEYSKVD